LERKTSGNKPMTKKAEPLNPFQSKLMELKKKFND
jgi:protein Tex